MGKTAESTEKHELDDEDFDDGKETVKTPTAAELAEKYSYKEGTQGNRLIFILYCFKSLKIIGIYKLSISLERP